MTATLSRLIIVTLLFLQIDLCAEKQSLIIVLDPAGDAKKTGRQLENRYERAATFEYAQRLKLELEDIGSIKALLSRSPGDTLQPFQIANTVNKLPIDLFIRLHCYKHDGIKPNINILYSMVDPIIDGTWQQPHQYTFIPLRQAHCQSLNKTKALGHTLFTYLHSPEYQTFFDVTQPLGLPLKVLQGFMPPALIIEIGEVANQAGADAFIKPLAQQICRVLGIQ